jgi:chemotaxis protein methyltransferase CheR
LEISIDEFKLLGEFIYRKVGIRFEENKIYFLNKRVGSRMQSLKIETVTEYINYIRFLDNGNEMQQLVNLITVNETYFFREYEHLQAFAEICIPEIIERKRLNSDYRLRIWSAGCSSGEEPYTLAIILREMLDNITHWQIEIQATDIDKNILQNAVNAVYSERSIKDVPPEYFDKYFTASPNRTYALVDKVKDMVKFNHQNLSDTRQLRQYRAFDFIFCRNVLIYFDEKSRKDVVDHFYTALNQGGYVFLGSSESASRITTAFKIKRAGDMLVYCKES